MRTLSLLALVLLLSACEGMPKRPAEEAVATAAAGYGRAFGRVQYLENGKEVALESTGLFTSQSLTLFVRTAGGGSFHYMEIDGDGSFFWPLPAGQYEIVGVHFERSHAGLSRFTSRVMASFTLPKAGDAVYIGELQINAGRGLRILDSEATALQRVEDRLKEGKFEPVKGLMRFEQPPGRYQRVIPVCRNSWGVDCDKAQDGQQVLSMTFQGVEPLQPTGTALGFPLTETVSPLLEWKPSTRSDVTYDVAIYESISFSYGMKGTILRLRGSLADYAEGLREPRYTPASLAPGKQYEWTVRLREGDVVSYWSSRSHSVFALVAWSRGSGAPFGFETPGR